MPHPPPIEQHEQVTHLQQVADDLSRPGLVVEVDPVPSATSRVCRDDGAPATVTVSFFPAEGAHRCELVCVECAGSWMREAVEVHRTNYLDVEVRLIADELGAAA